MKRAMQSYLTLLLILPAMALANEPDHAGPPENGNGQFINKPKKLLNQRPFAKKIDAYSVMSLQGLIEMLSAKSLEVQQRAEGEIAYRLGRDYDEVAGKLTRLIKAGVGNEVSIPTVLDLIQRGELDWAKIIARTSQSAFQHPTVERAARLVPGMRTFGEQKAQALFDLKKSAKLLRASGDLVGAKASESTVRQVVAQGMKRNGATLVGDVGYDGDNLSWVVKSGKGHYRVTLWPGGAQVQPVEKGIKGWQPIALKIGVADQLSDIQLTRLKVLPKMMIDPFVTPAPVLTTYFGKPGEKTPLDTVSFGKGHLGRVGSHLAETFVDHGKAITTIMKSMGAGGPDDAGISVLFPEKKLPQDLAQAPVFDKAGLGQ